MNEEAKYRALTIVIAIFVSWFIGTMVVLLLEVYELLQHKTMSFDDKFFAGVDSMIIFVTGGTLLTLKQDFTRKNHYWRYKLWLIKCIYRTLSVHNENHDAQKNTPVKAILPKAIVLPFKKKYLPD